VTDELESRERLAAWQDALQAAELAARLVDDAIGLEPEGPNPASSEVADLAERVSQAASDASQRATDAAGRARDATPP
jgi:hypothetical protein